MAAQVTLVGEGGVPWEFDLPLSEVFADQVKNRKLLPADEASRSAVAHLFADEEEAVTLPPVAAEPPVEKTVADRINAAASHADANALAAELGVDGFEEKKPPLDAKRQQLHAAAQAKAEADAAEAPPA